MLRKEGKVGLKADTEYARQAKSEVGVGHK